MDLTEKQRRLYEAIRDYILEYGYSPSMRELCELIGVSSPATIHFGLGILKRKGYIDYKYNRSRTIVILK